MKKISLITALLLAAISSHSIATEVKGQVSYPYEGGVFSSAPSDKDKQNAIKAAKLAAFKKYTSSFSIAKQKLYSNIENEIASDIDKYISNSTIVAQTVDNDMKTINMVMRVTIDDSKINDQLKSQEGASSTGDGSLICSLFVARQITESKVFDARETKITEKASARDANSFSSSSGIEERAKTITKTTTGGNTVRKSSKDTFSTISTNDFDSAFSSVITSEGYEPAEYGDIHSECGGPSWEEIQKAFMKEDDLPRSLRNSAFKAAKACGVKYMSIGSMNVSTPMPDSVSGNTKVIVSINGMVWDISKKLPRRVGSIGPVQMFGLGPDQHSARREALRRAAEAAANAITDQLSAKHIH